MGRKSEKKMRRMQKKILKTTQDQTKMLSLFVFYTKMILYLDAMPHSKELPKKKKKQLKKDKKEDHQKKEKKDEPLSPIARRSYSKNSDQISVFL